MRVWGAIADAVAAHGRAALVTVLDTAGSTPREAGARMIIHPDGAFTGTIGGGTLEWKAIAAAQRMLGERDPPEAAENASLQPDPSTLRPSPLAGEGRLPSADQLSNPAPSPLGGEGGRRPDEGSRTVRRARAERVRPLALTLRGNQTDAEQKLWYHLRNRHFVGAKFRRQVPVGPYVADFACLKAKLIVEADGGQHNGSTRDAVRDLWLRNEGYRVLRFWNDEILDRIDMVLDMIWSALEEAGCVPDEDHHPSSALRAPSPPRGEGAGIEDVSLDEEAIVPYPDQLTSLLRVVSYALGPELGQCCGGRVELALERFDRASLDELRRIAAREAQGAFATLGSIDGVRLVRRVVAAGNDATGFCRNADGTIEERFGDDRRPLFLYGAGHVGRALVLALAPLPFRVVWIDPRPDAFPRAVPGNVMLVRPAEALAPLADAPAGAFVLVMSHSHALDLDVVDAALRTARFAYVGVIGSATKRVRFERRLSEMGHAGAAIAALVCPIGASGPKSKQPAVIAAAVAVELLVADEAARAAAASVDGHMDVPPARRIGGRAW